MKKIIYLKTEIKIGEMIMYEGLEIEVTQTLIDNNPDIFKVIDERQELLDKAKRDYPAGTVFRGLFGDICTVKNKPCYSIGAYSSILIDGIYVYRDGRWAEVLPLKFTTEDGVDIYGDMKTYPIAKRDLDVDGSEIYGGNSSCFKYFYHKENALAYIEKHKEKTLEDYESSLGLIVGGWFKIHEPKLYYIKILQLIADDLNDGRYIHIRRNTSYHLCSAHGVNIHCGGDEGAVYFKSKGLAQKARSILGDKVKYLFN